MKTKHKFLPFVILLAAFGLGTTFGQTASSSSATPDPVVNEDVVELSPFIVNAEEDTGYQAAKTLAGSRMGTDLKDTAASISVLTSEFLNDIAALNLEEAIAFGNNVELDHTNLNNDNGTNEFFRTFRIRGQPANVARNYFRWKLPGNTFNVERIEEARGPNSILFGIASSGGLISSQTKQASTDRSFRRGQFVFGSYNQRRVTVDLNQVLANGKLGVRFNGLLSDGGAYQHFAGAEDNRAHLAVKYNVTSNTVIRAEYEHGKTFQTTPMSQEVGDNVLKWINAGRPLATMSAGKPVANTAVGITLQGNGGNQSLVYIENDGVFRDYRTLALTQGASSAVIQDSPLVDNVNFRINIAGPGQTQATDFDTYSVFVQQKLGKKTFLELAYNRQEYEFEAWQSFRITGLQGDPNPFLKDGVTPNPHAGQLYFDNEWAQRLREESFDNFRLTVSHEFDFGKWGNYRMAALAERDESLLSSRSNTTVWSRANGTGVFNSLPTSSANTVRYRNYIVEGDTRTYHGSSANPGTAGHFTGVANPLVAGELISSRGAVQSASPIVDDPSDQDSLLLAAQAFYFNRKLVLAGGYRKDKLALEESYKTETDPVTGDWIVPDLSVHPRTKRDISSSTKTYGAVYHVLPWFSLRYNHSSSFGLPNPIIRITPRPDENGYFIGSRVGDPSPGEGEDYGFDLDLLDGKFFVRATRFETIQLGGGQFQAPNNPAGISNRIMDSLQAKGIVTPAERENHRVNSGGAETDTYSTGYELTVTANVTKNWRLQVNYSYTDSITQNYGPEIALWAATEIPYFKSFDQTILATGNKPISQEISEWEAADVIAHSVEGKGTVGNRSGKVSVVTSYSFSNGFLKGFNVGATARHQSKNLIAVNNAGNEIYGNSFTRADAFLGYRFARETKAWFLKNLSLQLNVLNVLDQHDPLKLNVADANATTLLFNRLRPQEPRSWRLTSNFSF